MASLPDYPLINRPIRAPQQTAYCVCRAACECGRSYTGETGGPLAVRRGEHRRNLQGHLEKSRIAQFVFEEEHPTACNLGKILQIEKYSVYRKYKEA